MPTDLVDRARSAVHDRAELPGMSLMEHLDELRKRILWAVVYLVIGCTIAWFFHTPLVNLIQKPLLSIGLKMTMTHPTDAINFDIKTAVVFGAIFSSPAILYQIWLFISPGMYANEKRFVMPFMAVTVLLFLGGAYFGYRYVLPGAMQFLVVDLGKNFTHMITIEDYTGFFMSVILGLGFTFEMPVVIFFLALFGIVDAKFLLRHFRYAVLAIFLLAAILCPDPSPIGMTLFAMPMLVLYFVGVLVAWRVHPDARNKKKAEAV
jgi:sec-independent protein translocase protein TatC